MADLSENHDITINYYLSKHLCTLIIKRGR